MTQTADELRAANYRLALGEQHIQANGCAVNICGYMTGHFSRAIAFCDSPEAATAIVDALKEQRDRAIAAAEAGE